MSTIDIALLRSILVPHNEHTREDTNVNTDSIVQAVNDARNMTYRLRDVCTDSHFRQTDSFGRAYNVPDFDKIALGMQVYITSKLDYIERQLKEENNASGN